MDINHFLCIENKHTLYTKQINGINYWNYARMQIWNYQICTNKLNMQEAHPMNKSSLILNLRAAANMIKNSIIRGKVISNIDILFSAHDRRIYKDGVYQCIYVEPLAKLYPNSVILDRPYECMHKKPESNLKRYYSDYIVVIGNIYYQSHKFLKTSHYKKTLQHIKEQMEDPLKELIDGYHLSISVDKLYEILHKRLLTAEYEITLYDKLLNKFKPQVIVEVVYYSMHNMILNELAKKRGIPVVELQHGTMHKDHAAYQINWADGIPQLPDQIFLFSEFWKKMIKVPIDSTNLIVTGFPYFEENLQRYHNMKTADAKKTIIFISQGTIGSLLSKLAVEAARELIPRGYHILYKLHPAEFKEWEENYPELRISDIDIIGVGDKDIYECFSCSSIQVGVYSTALYEGLGFGLRTFIYNVGHADTMFDLVDMGYAQVINNVGELVDLLNEKADIPSRKLFWESDALLKMNNELQKMLKKR